MKRNLNSLLDRIVDRIINLFEKRPIRFIVEPFLEHLYLVYEKYLYNQIKGKQMPMHVAIIPDGNRRWAKRLGLDPKEGHIHGYTKMKEVLQWLYDLGIKIVTVYAMSYENCLYRSEDEKENLFEIIINGFRELQNSGIIEKYGVHIKVFGKLELAKKSLVEEAKKLEQISINNRERYLNIAICYGGRQEIIDAVKSIAEEVKRGILDPSEIVEDVLLKKLSTSHLPMPEPDLVIRTSGELRISNFLLWQIAYSELYFCDVYWPSFRKIDLYRAIRSYQSRERRFGK